MKAAEKNKIAIMMCDRIEAILGDEDLFFDQVWDFCEEYGFDHFVRSCDPKHGVDAKLPPTPRDTKNKIHVMIARESVANAYYWWDERRARQLWVCLDRDFATKALVFGFLPETIEGNDPCRSV